MESDTKYNSYCSSIFIETPSMSNYWEDNHAFTHFISNGYIGIGATCYWVMYMIVYQISHQGSKDPLGMMPRHMRQV